jgi:hypothetical protein
LVPQATGSTQKNSIEEALEDRNDNRVRISPTHGRHCHLILLLLALLQPPSLGSTDSLRDSDSSFPVIIIPLMSPIYISEFTANLEICKRI